MFIIENSRGDFLVDSVVCEEELSSLIQNLLDNGILIEDIHLYEINLINANIEKYL